MSKGGDMKSLFLSCLLFWLGFTFCTDSINQSEDALFKLSDTLSLHYQEKLVNNDENISISFNSLISDGRCPTDLKCFWEGDAELLFEFRKDNQSSKFSLHTAGNYFTKDTLLYGYSIKLMDVHPYPHSKTHYEPEEYVAKLVIE